MALLAHESLSSCPDCGAVVPLSRVQLHEEWHAGLEQPAEPAGIDLDPWPEIDAEAPSSL